MPLLWWMELKGSAVSSSVCSGVYGFDMALGSPSANGKGCVSVLQIVWREVSRTEGFGSLGGALAYCLHGALWESSCQLTFH